MAFYHDQVRLLKELRASLELPVTGGYILPSDVSVSAKQVTGTDGV